MEVTLPTSPVPGFCYEALPANDSPPAREAEVTPPGNLLDCKRRAPASPAFAHFAQRETVVPRRGSSRDASRIPYIIFYEN